MVPRRRWRRGSETARWNRTAFEHVVHQVDKVRDIGNRSRPSRSMWRAYLEIWHIRSRLYLAKTYERLERYDKARAQCEWVLERWANADSGLAIVEEARERLARLSQRP